MISPWDAKWPRTLVVIIVCGSSRTLFDTCLPWPCWCNGGNSTLSHSNICAASRRGLLFGRLPGVLANTCARDRATDGFSATFSTISGAMMVCFPCCLLDGAEPLQSDRQNHCWCWLRAFDHVIVGRFEVKPSEACYAKWYLSINKYRGYFLNSWTVFIYISNTGNTKYV